MLLRWFTRLLLIAGCFIYCTTGNAQYQHQFRLSEDDDVINIRGDGTDEAYSSGLRLEYFVEERKHFFLQRLLPKAGNKAINTISVGISHLIYTPHNLDLTTPEPTDYPYAGALFGSYSLHSTNPLEKYNVQTELIAGVMGPHSYAKEIQQFVHRLLGDEQPRGWNNQLQTDVLVNVNVAVEKQALAVNNWADIMAGGVLEAGSMTDAAGVYAIVRAGKMNSWFNGIIDQNSAAAGTANSRWQVYLIAKPGVTYVAYNALLQGGFILKRNAPVSANINHLNISLDYGLMLVYHNFSASVTQKTASSPIRGRESHETGNISLYFSW
jgi:lipid A 3-O-deacylase